MQIVICQLDSVWEDKSASFGRVRALLDAAPPARNALVVLPEMFATGFSMRVANITDTAERETERFLSDTAREYGVWVTGGLVTTGADGRGRNESVTFDPQGREAARYSKIRPFISEQGYYTAGERTVLFSCEEFTVAPFICYDLRFPEIFRPAARRGAQLYTVIANWPVARINHWRTLLQARAIENQAYVVGVNRCGSDPKLNYNGNSLVVAPDGEILVDAGEEEGLATAEISLSFLQDYRKKLPFLEDLHPDYVRLEE